jgi:sarcosine oxidase subunit gamma
VTAEARRRTALASRGDALDAIGAREVLLASQIAVRVEAAGADVLGLPTAPNTWVALGDREALWLGPDEWLVTSESEPAADVVGDVEARLQGSRHAVVDVSANRVVIELAGVDRLLLLSAGCGLDLDPRSWHPGMCAQTLLANVAVLLQERVERTRVFLRPSFADHLAAWLGRVAGPPSTIGVDTG